VRYGIENKVAMNYIDKNRKEMNTKYPDFKKFNANFTITDDILETMKEMATEEKIEFNEEQFNQSKELISLRIKALIARDLFEMSEYFQIINKENDSYQKALEIINNDKAYMDILSGGTGE
jgi:carboxyl-terminal processing protease